MAAGADEADTGIQGPSTQVATSIVTDIVILGLLGFGFWFLLKRA